MDNILHNRLHPNLLHKQRQVFLVHIGDAFCAAVVMVNSVMFVTLSLPVTVPNACIGILNCDRTTHALCLLAMIRLCCPQ